MEIEKEMQKLLEMIFEAEKMYFEAAQEVQLVEFTRFLNFQSSKRNKFANEIVEVLTSHNMVATMLYIEKGIRSENQETSLLGREKYIHLMIKCLNFDGELIDTITELLNKPSLSIEIAEVITRVMTFLIFQHVRGAEMIKRLNKEREINIKESKIVRLQSY
ncbi:hypothetical protein [Aquimarina spongiae]|uniref:Ferritin-like metal-binding protein YciE n=1 Tax=Aquimarina spongiae TaxID=570521 RepID=A0A1M6GMK0_9FLAO|nr:hypothetical protein [Aquimarina spongiae]SHJ11123.1 hypothetical protein SAMN04488508_105352 [Aquimarina spongiae]